MRKRWSHVGERSETPLAYRRHHRRWWKGSDMK
nr:MAG TPA: hypothetical protein [Caudoviricetes sp.]